MAIIRATKEFLESKAGIDYLSKQGIELNNGKDIGSGIFEFYTDIKGFTRDEEVIIILDSGWEGTKYEIVTHTIKPAICHLTKDQIEDAQSGEWLMQEVKNRFDNKPKIKKIE